MPTTDEQKASPRVRRRRWPWIAAGAAGVVLALVGASPWIAAACLRTAWARQRIAALLHRAAGLDVDWGRLDLEPLSGLRLDGLVLRSPPAYRAVAPDLARVGGIEVDWSLASLSGHGPPIERIVARDVALAVVADAGGGNSIAALVPPGMPSPPPSNPTPLSGLAAKLLAGNPPVRRIEIDGLSTTLLRTADGSVVERDRIEGLSVRVAASHGTTGWALRIDSDSRLRLRRERSGTPAQEASGTLRITGGLWASSATATVDIAELRQDFVPGLDIEKLLHVQADAKFNPGQVDIQVAELDAAGGAARARASVAMPDAAPPHVLHASLDVDLGRIAPLARAAGLVDLGPVRGTVEVKARGLELGALPGLERGGEVETSGDVSGLKLGRDAVGVEVTGARWSIGAQPGAGSRLLANGTLALTALRFHGPEEIAADGVELRVDGADFDLFHPATSQAKVDGEVASLTVADRRLRIGGAAVRLRLSARGLGGGDADVALGRLALARGGRTLFDGPVHAALHLEDLVLEPGHLLASRGKAHAQIEAGPLHAVLILERRADSADVSLSADAASLEAARIFQPADARWKVPWGRLGLSLRTSGRFDGAGAEARLKQTTRLHLDRPGLAGMGPAISARSIELALSSDGTLRREAVSVDLALSGLAIGGGPARDAHLRGKVDFDAAAPSARAHVETSGDWPALRADLGLDFDRARRSLAFEATAEVKKLAALAPLLPASRSVDLAELGATVSARGRVRNVVTSVAADGVPRFARDALEVADGAGTVDVAISNLHWTSGDREADVPAAGWHGSWGVSGQKRHVEGDVTAGTLRFAAGPRIVTAADLADHVAVTATGDPATGTVEIANRLTLRSVRQPAVRAYPVGGVAVDLAAQVDAARVVRISRLAVDDRAGGSSIALHGGLVLGSVVRKLSLRGEFRQDLAKLSGDPEALRASGNVSLGLRIESPDMKIFHTSADVRLESVDLALPKQGVRVESAGGEIPVDGDLSIGPSGIRWRRGADQNPYLRFSDQHPLLHRRSFFSIARLVTPDVEIAPIAGNLAVDRNLVTVSQLELGLRGGRVSGRCVLDWAGRRTTLLAHVRATGVLSSHGEPFDGNAALLVSAGDRSIDGQAEILRIGRRHLLDLLDLQDPHRTNPAANRIRGALALGYPDHVHLSFDHGFANLRVTFGGIAGLVKVSEMRGIPVEPLVDRLVATLSEEPP